MFLIGPHRAYGLRLVLVLAAVGLGSGLALFGLLWLLARVIF